MSDAKSLKLELSGSLPGEAAIAKICEYATMVRQTMDPELAKRLDNVTVTMVEDAYKVWRGIWVAAGVLTS
ncbi:MAG TPA: hypothetical protein VN428_02285 [Bryobacteraceae bacterium]|nr:hypothetical protein [Bryobacteraceae bacterium]